MASGARFPYQKLRHGGMLAEEAEGARWARRQRKFSRLRGFSFNRRRLNLRIPGLRKLLGKRLSRVKISWRKALKRIKNGQVHMNDLFGGNYLVMQASPTPFKRNQTPKSSHGS